jgi:hypothetical protein
LADSCYFANTCTIHEDKTYTTISKFTVNAPIECADKVLAKFHKDLIEQPLTLNENMFSGLDGDGKELFVIEYKSHKYDDESKLYTGIMNVLVGNKTLTNTVFSGKMMRNSILGQSSTLCFDLYQTNAVVKGLQGTIEIKKIDENTVEVSQTSVSRFAWFFDIFFGQNNYKNIVEWRIDKFMENMNREILLEKAKQTNLRTETHH